MNLGETIKLITDTKALPLAWLTLILFYLLFDRTEDWAQCLPLARQRFYHLNHVPVLLLLGSCYCHWCFFFSFQIESHSFTWVLALNHNPPTCTLWLSGIPDLYHHTWLTIETVSQMLFSSMALKHILFCLPPRCLEF
jgi:hypothetical protein